MEKRRELLSGEDDCMTTVVKIFLTVSGAPAPYEYEQIRVDDDDDDNLYSANISMLQQHARCA